MRILTKKESSLLINSTVSKGNPDLINFIRLHANFDTRDWAISPPEIRLFERYFPNYVNQLCLLASAEWSFTGKLSEVIFNSDHERCQLCGHVGCILLYPIKNLYNERLLYIGSECVKAFGFTGKERVAIINGNQLKVRQYRKLIDTMDGVFEEFVIKKNSIADESKFIIPDPLYTQCHEKHQLIANLAAAFVRTDDPEEEKNITDRITQELTRYKELSIAVKEFEETNKNNILVPLVIDVRTSRTKDKAKLVKDLRQAGEIDKTTIKCFDKVELLEQFVLCRLPLVLSELGFSVDGIKIHPHGNGYVIHNRIDLPLFLLHQRFGTYYGSYLFAKVPIGQVNLEKFINICMVSESPQSFLHNAMSVFSTNGINLLNYSETMNELHLFHDGRYKKVALYESINESLYFFIFPDSQFPETLRDRLGKAEIICSSDKEYQALIDRLDKQGIDFFRI